MAKDEPEHISEETERRRSAQFGRIASWTEPHPKRPPRDDEEHDGPAAAEAS
jgi:hypothetical protein